jgi:hypothetical protein
VHYGAEKQQQLCSDESCSVSNRRYPLLYDFRSCLSKAFLHKPTAAVPRVFIATPIPCCTDSTKFCRNVVHPRPRPRPPKPPLLGAPLEKPRPPPKLPPLGAPRPPPNEPPLPLGAPLEGPPRPLGAPLPNPPLDAPRAPAGFLTRAAPGGGLGFGRNLSTVSDRIQLPSTIPSLF